MNKKWKLVNVANLKPGDRFKAVSRSTTVTGVIHEWGVGAIRDAVGNDWPVASFSDWYTRTPKKPKPLTRPEEPPVGSFFRVDRTGDAFQRCVGDGDWCYLILGDSDRASDLETWGDITEPGDTITKLRLVEVPDWSWVADE